jgi:hypothetical protein
MATSNRNSKKSAPKYRKDHPYNTAKPGDLPIGYEYVPAIISQPALISQVTMQDYSMSPTFWEGDKLTIDTEMEPTSGSYMLIQLGNLFLVRRMIYSEHKPLSFVGGLGARPIVDGKNIVKLWGVVTAVEHVRDHHPDGIFKEFDQDKLEMYGDGDDESKETEEEIAKVKAHFEAAAVFA